MPPKSQAKKALLPQLAVRSRPRDIDYRKLPCLRCAKLHTIPVKGSEDLKDLRLPCKCNNV